MHKSLHNKLQRLYEFIEASTVINPPQLCGSQKFFPGIIIYWYVCQKGGGDHNLFK